MTNAIISATATDDAGNITTFDDTDTESVDNQSAVAENGGLPDLLRDENDATDNIDLDFYFDGKLDPDANLTYSILPATTDVEMTTSLTDTRNHTLVLDYDDDGGVATETVAIRATDDAGNTFDQTFTIDIEAIDVEFSVTVSDPSSDITEVSAGSFTYTITKEEIGDGSASSGNDDVLNYSSSVLLTLSDAASDPADYVSLGGDNIGNGSTHTLTFASGEYTKTIVYNIFDDAIVEAAEEDVTATLSSAAVAGGNGTASVVAPVSATKTILDDDQAVITMTPVVSPVTEGDVAGDNSVIEFDVEVSNYVDIFYQLSFSSVGVLTATEGTDFEATAGDIQYPALSDPTDGTGTRTFRISVPIVEDETVEAATESFYMSLFNIRDIADDAILTSERDIVFAATSDQTDYYVEGEITDDDIAYVVWDNSLPYQAGEGGDVTFRAKLVGSVDQSISVVYLPQNGDTEVQAINNVDFVSSSGSFTLSGTNGSTDDVDFSTLEDNLVEVDEEFKLRMSLISANGKNVKFSNSESSPSAVPNITKTGKIIDNDAVKISVASTVDANESTGLATFTFSMADDIDGGDATKDDATNTGKVVDVLTTVYYRIDTSSTYTRHGSGLDFYDPTATKNGSDEIVGTITFAANSNADVDLNITITDDNIVELDETFTITITDILTGVEPDDDVTLAGSFPGVAERLSSVTTDVDTDTYTIINDEFADVVMTTDVVSAAEGTQLMTVTMELRDGDNLANTITVDEAVTVEYILNEDEALRADLDDNIRFAIVNSPDYAGTITFAAGESSKDIDVIWTDDAVVEDDEDFEFAITSVSASGRAVDEDLTTPTPVEQTNGNTAALTILNDDFTDFTITVEAGDDNDVNEEVGTLSYTVTSTKAVEAGFELLYSIAGSSVSEKAISTGGLDLTSAESGVVQFLGNAGEEVALDITIRNDFLVELDEELEVSIAIPATDYTPTNGSYPFVFKQTVDTDPYYGAITNANVVTESQYGYIRNTDAATITIEDETPLNEGDPGADVSYTFTVSLSNPIDVDVEVPLTYLVDGLADGSDYIADKLAVSFGALDETAVTGPYTQDFLISVVEDIQVEDDEVFTATLPLTAGLDWDTETARNVTVPTDGDTNVGTTTFLNDDAAEFRIEALGTDNSDEESASTVTYTISLYDEDGVTLTSADEEIAVDIAFDMSNLNDNNFITDFVEATAFTDGTSGTVTTTPSSDVYTFTVTFDADQTQETFSFKFDDDDVVEQDAGETYSVSLVGNGESNISDNDNADVITNDGSSQTYTINEVVDKATITISDNTAGGSIAEDGAGSVVYTISSDKDIEVPLTIAYTIAEQLTGEAFAATDINTAGSGTELDLQYNATDDAYGTDDGASAVTFTVVINTDDIVEADEDYDVTLTSTIDVPGSATYLASDYDANVLVAAAGSGGAITNTITNDDNIELASFTGDTDVEANDLDMALSIVKAADIDVHLTIQESVAGTSALTNGQAFANNANTDTDRAQTDFTAPGTTSGAFTYLTIPAGATSANEVLVTVTDDDIVERNEPFYLTVTGVKGASAAYDEVVTGQTLDDRTADFVITNDDAIEFTFAGNVTDAEEDGPFTFTMSADAEVDVDYSVDYLVASGGGNNTEADFTDITDFGTYSESVAFTGAFTAASAEEVPFDINIVDDNIVELNETFTVSFRSVGDYTTIFNDAGYTFGDAFTGTATGTIENDPTVDNAVITVSSSSSQSEGTGGSSTVTYNITISNPVDAGFNLPYEVLTAGGLGTVNASDFTNATITYNIDGAGAVDPAADVIPVALSGTTTPFGNDIIVVQVPVVEDAIVEPDEDMSFTLTNAFTSPGARPIYYEDAGTPAATASSTTTLLNDDATSFTLQVTSNGDGVDFSTGEATDNISFTLTASNQIQDNVTLELNFDLSNVVSTAVSATQGDYVTTGLGADDDVIFTFGGANATSQTFTLDLFDDAADMLVEIDEVFGVSLTDLDVTTTYTALPFGGTGTASNWIGIEATGDAALSVTLVDDDEAFIDFSVTSVSRLENADGGATTTFDFTVTNSTDIDTPVTVNWTTTDGTTGDNASDVGEDDITAVTAGTQLIQLADDYTISVTVADDDIVELDETFTVTLNTLSGAGTVITSDLTTGTQDALREVVLNGDLTANATVENDDMTQVYLLVSAGDASTANVAADEGDAGSAGSQTLTLMSDLVIDHDIYVNIDPQDGTYINGASGADYSVGTEALLTAGNTSETFSVSFVGDEIMERDETVTIELNGLDLAENALDAEYDTYISDDEGDGTDVDGFSDNIVVTISNDDILDLTLTDDAESIANTDQNESATFVYTLNYSNDFEVYTDDTNFAIDWSLDLTPASAPSEDDSEAADFDATSGSFNLGGFTPGVASVVSAATNTTYTLTLVDDNLVELDEHFTYIANAIDSDLNLNGRSALFDGGLTSLSYDGVIVDTDVATVTLVGGGSISESDVTDPLLAFTVQLSNPVDEDVRITFFSDNGTGLTGALTEDDDYSSTTGDITWTAGDDTDKNFNITITGDYKVEDNENVGAFIQDLFIGSAVTAGNLWFQEVTFAGTTGSGTILNDDVAVVVLNDATLNNLEGDDAGSAGFSSFEASIVDLDDGVPASVDRIVSVNYNAINGVAISTDTDPVNGDFLPANGTFTFTAGSSTSQSINVTYVGDETSEPDEDFEVQLTTLSIENGDTRDVTVTAVAADKKGTGTILNDDRPYFDVALATGGDGDESGLVAVEFEITLTNRNFDDVTIDWEILDGSAVLTDDYTVDYGQGNSADMTGFGRLTVANGTNASDGDVFTETITVNVAADALAEGTEDLQIRIFNAQSSSFAELKDEVSEIFATGSIADDDPIAIAISGNQTVFENAGTATVAISFTGTIVEDVTVDYTVTSSGADATDFDVDETTYTGSFTFSASDGASVTDGSTNVIIDLLDDGIVEGNESVTVTLDAVTTVVDTDFVSALPSVVTIDDEDAAVISISSFSVGEADGVATVEVTSDTQIDRDVTVQLTIAETGTASDADADGSVTVGGSDFAASVQTVTISALDLTGSFDVTINEDVVVEGSEDFDISITTLGGDGISNFADVTLGASAGVVTITDNDAAQISIADVTVDEGTGLANVLLSLDKVIDEDITVDYFTTQATAIDGSDYTGVIAGTPAISIVAGSGLAAMPINVPVTINNADGGLVEGTETLTVTVENIVGGALTDQSISFLDDDATVTINDDDQAIISIADISNTETNLNGAQTVSITLDAPVDEAITFRLSTEAVTATDDDNATTDDVDETDYVQISNQLITVDASTLVPNATVEVTINDDNLVEADETFNLRLSTLIATGRNVIFDGGGATVSSTVSITEDDAAIINITDIDQTATGDDESNNMSFVISITNPIDQDVELTLNTTNGLATAGSDFTALTDEIYTIPASTLSANLSPQVVIITPDVLVERDENFTLAISGFTVPSGRDVTLDGGGTTKNASGLIEDNDEAQITIVETATGTEGVGETITFTISMSNPVDASVVFNASTLLNDNATVADLIQISDQQVTFPAESNDDKTVTVNLTNNDIVEGDESFDLELTDLTIPTGRAVAFYDNVPSVQTAISSTATISDDDSADLTIADITVDEGDATATVVLTTDFEVDTDVSVDVTYEVTGSATDTEDYTSATATSTATITAGSMTSDIVIPLLDGTIVEGTETLNITIGTLTFTDATHAIEITDNAATVTINDDDVTTLSIVDASSDEGTDIVIEVTSDLAFDKAVTVDLASLAGSATATDDYGTVAGTVAIAQGATSGTVNVTTVDDALVDGEETFSGTISNLSVGTGDGYNASIADADGVFTINDLDAALLSIASATSFTEGGTATVTLSSDVAIDEAVDVTFTYSGVSATTGDDFTENLGPITLPALSTADGATLSVTLPNTAGVSSTEVVEGTETFTVSIDGITVANDASHDVSETGGDASATVTIDDNDTAVITLADANASEGDAMTFTVSTDVEFDKNVTVSLSTANNTALSGATEDYSALAGSTVTITGGTLSGSITTTTVENVIVEGTEDFTATISGLSVGPVGTDGYDASITDADGTYTINDDDAAVLTLSGMTVDESAGTATVTLTSDLAADADISVSLAVTDGTASATDGDYSATDGPLTITAGNTSTTATITISDDAIAELDESVVNTISGLTVSSDHDVTLDNTTADVTITDNDAAEIAITGVTINEADGTADLTLTISGQVDTEVTVSAATANGTALVSDDDYVAKTQTVTFAALSTTDQTFSVAVNDDNIVENDETFAVNLSGLSVGGRDVTLASTTANVTITNDDAAIISIADATINEAAGSVTLTINMDNPVDGAVTFTARTIQGTARNVDDYERVSGVTYTIDAGELLPSTTASITIVDDNLVEATETFEYELSAITSLKNVRFTGGTGTTSATVTINDADAAVISINSAEVSEGDGVMTFTVSMSAPVDEAVSVYATSGNVEASAGTDFTSVNNSQITFSAGSNTDKTVSVSITDNTIVEAIETFTITLNNIEPASGKNVTFVNGETTAVGIGTINDDDSATITLDDVSADEGVSGTKDYVFTATLTGRVDEQVDVPYSTSDVTATAGVDYTAATGTISFAANNVSGIETKTITVSVNGDLEVEADELFNVILGSLSLTGKDVTITDGTGEGEIVNDDVLPEIVADQTFSVSEAAVVNELIGVIQVADLTPGSVSWSITFGNTDAIFDINDTNNQLFVADNSNLDRDKTGGDSYTLTLTVSDGVNTSESEDISITVTDINDNDPVITADQVFTVSDDAPLNAAVGTVLVTDADENPVFGDFLITSGNADGVFTINGSTGVITVADNETLDFESTASYTLTITVSDGANTSANGTVTINVTDTNDAPEALIITDAEDEDEDTENVDILESATVQTVVATFETTDIDVGDSHTYSLVDHPDGEETQNGLFRIQGNELQVNQDLVNLGLFDGIATIVVQSEDTGGGTIVEVFEIVVINDPLLGLDQIYNVITPGRVDGLNDFWTIEGIEAFPGAEIIVNDKFGNVVYRSTGYDSPFDGTKGNAELPTDTYSYRIELNDGSGRTYEGSITILAYK
ncbi:MAG: Calx-beta domain-containing protein [Cyclobacteriaceae bacterium]